MFRKIFEIKKNLKFWISIFISGIIVYILMYDYLTSEERVDKLKSVKKYLIQTSGCRIVELNPFDPLVKKCIYKEKPIQCNKNIPPLVEANLTTLRVLKSSLKAYGIKKYEPFVCCYSYFERKDPKNGTGGRSTIVDNRYCVEFNDTIQIREEFVKVWCFKNGSVIYKDIFSFVPPKFSIDNAKSSSPKPLNVLLVGLDAVSRVNLHRQMSKTVEILTKDLQAVEFLGYNKVGDNSYPNLIPLFTGLSEEELAEKCHPHPQSYFDECPFIWKEYKKKGFVTCYAEDTSWMGTFDYYDKVGFQKQPTDYYWRTYNSVAEKDYGNMLMGNSNFCIGARPQYQTLLDYTKNFVDVMSMHKKQYFGFFWSSSLTHDFLNYPKLGDSSYASFLKHLQQSNILNDTFLIFLSDHGIRWGCIRKTKQGMLEDRLPFAFFVLPEWFKQKYKTAYSNLVLNSKRLTTVFDFYKTLKVFLDPYNIIDNENEMKSSNSLLDLIPENRNCQMARISKHWCSCSENKEIEKDSPISLEIANFAVSYLNQKLTQVKQCHKLKLQKILNVRYNSEHENSNLNGSESESKDYIVTFTTIPGNAMLEITVQQKFLKNIRNSSYALNIVGPVSRLNSYGKQSECINNSTLKLYCYCKKFNSKTAK